MAAPIASISRVNDVRVTDWRVYRVERAGLRHRERGADRPHRFA